MRAVRVTTSRNIRAVCLLFQMLCSARRPARQGPAALTAQGHTGATEPWLTFRVRWLSLKLTFQLIPGSFGYRKGCVHLLPYFPACSFTVFGTWVACHKYTDAQGRYPWVPRASFPGDRCWRMLTSIDKVSTGLHVVKWFCSKIGFVEWERVHAQQGGVLYNTLIGSNLPVWHGVTGTNEESMSWNQT